MKKLLIHPEELSKAWIDRMVRQGVQILGLHPEGGKNACRSAEALVQRLQEETFRSLIDYACDQGLEIEYELHAASFLLPRELFDAHPEYFRIENGVHTPQSNFCATNSEALEILTDNAVALAQKLYRSRPYYYFWLDDTHAKYCACPQCSGLSIHHQQLLVMNAMIRKLQSAIAGAKLCFLAYHGTEKAPEQIIPEKGIFLEYAPMNRNFDAPASAISGEAKDNLARLINIFGKEDATVLEYWYDNSLFSKWTKPPRAFVPRNDLIPEDVQWYQSLGFAHIASFACFLGEDYVNLYGEPDISAF